jgi:hypothetical protein
MMGVPPKPLIMLYGYDQRKGKSSSRVELGFSVAEGGRIIGFDTIGPNQLHCAPFS